jgi:CTD small phosphatase-like protein 2
VDNNPLSFLANPENGILVNNFYNDPDDTTLFAVLDLLDELDQAQDVRPLLEERFSLKQALEEVGQENDEEEEEAVAAASE